MKEAAGKELPSGVTLKFVENDGARMTIILPDLVEDEMSEEELDKVAGGTIFFTVGMCGGTFTCGCN